MSTSVDNSGGTPAGASVAEPPRGVAGTAAARRRLRHTLRPRASRGQLLAGLLCAVLGFALVTQVRQTQQEGIASLRQSDLVRILTGLNDQSSRLESEARGLESTRQQLTSGSDTAQAAEAAARERLDVLGVLTGTSAAQGPGIDLVIQDPNQAVTAAVLLDTLQELRDAGAEAIQLGDVRVVASSHVVDGKSGIEVDGTPLQAPYRLRAIGDPQTMAAALDIPGGVMEVLRQAGATGTVSRPAEVTIDALTSLPNPRYASPAPEKSP